jgi:hypothetical protein
VTDIFHFEPPAQSKTHQFIVQFVLILRMHALALYRQQIIQYGKIFILVDFIHDKYRFAKWGKIKIGQALQLKKIPQSVFYRYLNEIDEDEYLAILDNLLAVKRKSVHAENEYELNNKLVRFALSRGFEMKDIRHCITLSDENDELE